MRIMTQPAPAQDNPLEDHTDLPVGEILRRTRVYYEQSLDQVAAYLRIRMFYLDCIEKGKVERLPGRVYAIGFVRAYSEYLGLDGDKMVHLFKTQSVGGVRFKPSLHFHSTATDSKVPGLLAILGGLAGAVILLASWSAMHGPARLGNEIPEVPESLREVEIVEPPAPAPETPLASESSTETAVMGPDPQKEAVQPEESIVVIGPQIPENRMTITALDNSWVEIRDTAGAVLLRQVLKPGDQYLVPDQPGLLLSTGNAGGLTITIDDKEAAPLGTLGEVKRDISLNPEELLKSGAE